MINFKSNLIKFIKYFDMVEVGISFQINNEDMYKSICGGIIWLLFALGATAYFLYNFIPFANRENLTLFYTHKLIQKPVINLEKQKIVFGFALMFGNYSLAYEKIKDYLDYEIQSVYSDPEGKKNQTFPFHTCSRDDFPDIEEEVLKANSAYEYSCVEFPANYSLIGFYTEDVVQRFFLNIKIKEQYLNNDSALKKIMDNNPILAGLLFKDITVNYDNFSTPLNYYLQYQEVYLDFNHISYGFVYLSSYEFISDSNLFIPGAESDSRVIFDSFAQSNFIIRDRTTFLGRRLSNVLLHFEVLPTNKKEIFSRNYQKVPDFFSNIIGIIEELGILFFFFVIYFKEKSLDYNIINRATKSWTNKNFDWEYFQRQYPRKFFEVLQTEKDYSVIEAQPVNSSVKEEMKTQHDNRNICNPIKLNHSDIPPNAKNKVNAKKILMLTIPKPIRVQRISFMCWSAFPCCTKKRNSDIIHNGNDITAYAMEIYTYLKHIHEMDLMKIILLSDDEKKLFNFLTKPALCLNYEKNDLYAELRKEKSYEWSFSRNQIDEIFQSYNTIDKKKYKTRTDNRLITLVENELRWLNEIIQK